MEIRLLNKQALTEFIQSDEFAEMPHVPISKYRAQSQIKNPALQEEDVMLLLAYRGKEMIGYLGVLPGDITIMYGNRHIGWLSCIWVHPAARGLGVAKKLLGKALEAWEGKIVLTEFTHEAGKMYRQSGNFKDLAQKKGVKAFLRFNLHELLPKKKPVLGKIKILLKAYDAVLNMPINSKLNYLMRKIEPKNIAWEEVNEIDNETAAFIAQFKAGELFGRTADELNWIIRNPWVLNSEDRSNYKERYAFTAHDESFKNYTIKLTDKSSNQIIGFLMLTKRGGNLKTPYLYFDENFKQEVFNFLTWFAIEKRADAITTFNKELTNFIFSCSGWFIHRREQKRLYMAANALADAIEFPVDNKIQDGDGDVAFT